ncbi:MAG: hypothetical protein KatS3mg129_2310 [Leptospiraceae bacterium]|nr:MAG: hypothetical protein KatS3mg129_2310 [Leptospiraceae bacterium]
MCIKKERILGQIKQYNEWGGWKYIGHLWGSLFDSGGEWAENDADKRAMTNYYGGNEYINYLIYSSYIRGDNLKFAFLINYTGTYDLSKILFWSIIDKNI